MGRMRPQVYLATCRQNHGPYVLTCVPPSGHQSVGLATSCISSEYRIENARSKHACGEARSLGSLCQVPYLMLPEDIAGVCSSK